jgi:hypothetical protein
MNFLQSLRIGYAPCSSSLIAPGDRRRFCYYAARRNLRFEIARPEEAYDLVVLTQLADISLWSRYPRARGKVIFDFVDSYLAIPDRDPKGRLRGIAKFATRQNHRLLLNYKQGLETMCRRADAVVCSTESQREQILPLCPNVHRILDFHTSVVRASKSDYAAEEVFHFVWEGQPGNLRHLLEIKGALQDLSRTRPFRIHAITDLEYGRFLGGRWMRRSTVEEARRISPQIYLYAWNERTFSSIASACDLALIPIPLDDPLAAGKPENRLLLFWRMGIPALASATAAHVAAMYESGVSMACTTQQEWLEALQYFVSSEPARKHAAQRGMAFVAERHSEKQTLELWDQMFDSVLKEEPDKPQIPDSVSEVGASSPDGTSSARL